MLPSLNPPRRKSPLRPLFFLLCLVSVFSACRKPPPPPTLEAVLSAMPPAPVPAGSLLVPPAHLRWRRVNLLGQIRTALAPPAGLTIPLRFSGSSDSPSCSVRFALGLLPQYWQSHPAPVKFQLSAPGRILWEQSLHPAERLEQRGWQEQTFSCSALSGQTVEFSTDAQDYGALVTPFRLSRPEHGPAVILIVVDALRPDHLGAYGYKRPTSPNLDALAANGSRFENAVTASVFTLTSVASIFTGRYPWEHGVIFTRDLRLSPSLPLLAERFQNHGWLTAAFSGTYFRFSLEGFDRGFEVFDESCAQTFFRDSADCLNRAVLPWLKAHVEEPYFLYLHYVDPHAPYYAPEPFRLRFTSGHAPDHSAAGLGDAARFGDGRRWYQVPLRPTPNDLQYLKDLYDGEIAYADSKIGELLDFLRQTGRLDSTLLLVSADHGESFQEHGEMEHRKTLHDETLKVPLLLAGPGVPPGKVISDQVRTIDFGPTLLSLAFSQPINLGHGRDLRPLLEGDSLAPETALAAAYLGREHRLYALRTNDWKLILRFPGPAPELYRLTDDPLEQRNLASKRPPELDRLLQTLRAECPEAK